MTRQSIKQFIATLLCAVMVSSSLSISVLAEEPDAAPCEHSNTTIVEEAGTPASCTADGSHTVITVCADCGQELSRETITDPATGHEYQQTVTDPTCTEAGLTAYTCSICGDAYTEAGEAALGHNYLETDRVEAVCGQAGSITYTCSRCGDSYTEEIAALNHDYVQTVTEPTCTEDGIISYTCSVCGDTYTEAGEAALGHDYLETSRVEPACGQAGSVTYTCSRCGDSYTEEIAALEHDYVQEVTKPTCTEDGIITYTCSTCGDTYTEAGEAALGHDYLETERVEAACGQAGSITYTCSVCGDTYTEEIAALEHDYVQAVTKPTCTEDGIITYTCSACGDTYTENGEAVLGHDYLETERVEATYDAEGSVTYTCSRCEDSYTEVLPQLEMPEVPFEQIETVDGIQIIVTAAAGVFDVDAHLDINKSSNSDFTWAAEAVLGIESSENIIIRHDVFGFSGTEMNGSAQVKLENMDLAELQGTYPEGTISVYVLRYDEKAQDTEDKAKRVSADVNTDRNTVSFTLSELGLYDVITVIRLPENDADLTNDEHGEPVGGEQGEPTNDEQGEPVNDEQGEPTNDEQGEPVNDEQGEPTNDEQGEPVNGEQGEPTNDEQGEPVNGEQGEPTNDEQGEPVNDEQGETTNDEQGEPINDEQGEPVNGEQGETTNDEQDESVDGEQRKPTNDEQGEHVDGEQGEPIVGSQVEPDGSDQQKENIEEVPSTTDNLKEDPDKLLEEIVISSDIVWIEFDKNWDNDAHLDDYVQKLFDSGKSTRKGGLRSTSTAIANLTDSEPILYNLLKAEILKIASGERDSSEIILTSDVLENAGIQTGPWPGEGMPPYSVLLEKAGLESSNLSHVINALLSDCPSEMYWISGAYQPSYGVGTYTDGRVVLTQYTVNLYVAALYQKNNNNLIVDSSRVQVAQAAFYRAKQLAESTSGTTLEKLHAFKEWICDAVVYDDSAASNSSQSDRGPWRLVYVFDNNPNTNVVCEGYSKAFKYLCDLSGIPCILVTGTMDGGTGAGSHMWNIVTMDDGDNYLVDVTNCDTGSIGSPGKLFIAPFPGGSWNCYTFQNLGVTYDYDDETEAIFPQSLLTLSSHAYGQTVQEKYKVIINSTKYGIVNVDKQSVSPEETITLTFTPFENCDLDLSQVTFRGMSPATISPRIYYEGTGYSIIMGDTDIRVIVPFTTADGNVVVQFTTDGSTVSSDMLGIALPANSTYTLPACNITAPDDKVFKEWSVKIGDADPLYKAPNGTITLTADTTITPVWRDKSKLAFSEHSVMLSGQIGLQFFLQLPDNTTPADYPDSYVTFAGNKVNSTVHYPIPSSTATINGVDVGKYLFTVNLSSIQMADKITPTFHYMESGTEKTVVGDAFSVQDYIDWAMNAVTDPDVLRIIWSLADYGYYAQLYLSEQNHWNIGTDYTAITTHVINKYNYDAIKAASQNHAIVKGTNESITNVTYQMKFGSELALRITLTPASGVTISNVEVDGQIVSPIKSGDDYIVTISGIKATELINIHTIVAEGATTTVSPMSYVYSALSTNGVRDEIKDLVCALYNYAQACKK